jgi:multidrug efflux pump subunit AcrA (membrane-fusion protein)
MKLTAIAHQVAAVPFGSTGFDAQFTMAADANAGVLTPGMTCELRMLPYKKTDALVVPPKAVFAEELDPVKQFVYVTGKGNKPEKKSVTLGKRNEKQVEILLEKPKE